MIRFILKGLLRDKHRSLLPFIVISFGVMLTVLFYCYFKGVLSDSIDISARFDTGHVKIITRAYAENIDQKPNDLALLGVDSLMTALKSEYPQTDWVQRIQFGGLIDVPDAQGETRIQGPAVGIGVDLLGEQTTELKRLDLVESILSGGLPAKRGDILISDDFAKKLRVEPGDKVSFIGSTMYGSMAIANFTISGTVHFGVRALDRGALLADIRDVKKMLDMKDATSEILGYFNSGFYPSEKAETLKTMYNAKNEESADEFAPVMHTLRDHNTMGDAMDMIDKFTGIISFIFILAMSIVIWNAGLIGGLRRYGEFGLRLAIGESKSHVYWMMVAESILTSILGVITGTALGLFFAWLIETYGINAGGMMKNSSLMIPDVVRARITDQAYYVGIFPGLVSSVLGAMLSGIGIYKRKTATLFKELEN